MKAQKERVQRAGCETTERKISVSTLNVVIELIEPMLGTAPKNQDVYRKYIAEKAKELKPEIDIEAEVRDIQEVEEQGWTGFRADETGVYIPDYMIAGFLKEAGDSLKQQLDIKQHRSKIDKYVFVFPRKIYLTVNGELKKVPDGALERPLKAMTMQGPRVTLSRSDYVSQARLRFQIRIIENKDIGPDDIKFLLAMGEFKGLGQWRNAGWGRFRVVKINTIEESNSTAT